ncbi:hypothetical protein [Micromonospora okii]|uniref:hypothetical protein n=1 Tax=Micromonospora okii TaxID=1182970 RepID=UPI001E46F311|nr:hypothetical protein [Micromonospora okii]
MKNWQKHLMALAAVPALVLASLAAPSPAASASVTASPQASVVDGTVGAAATEYNDAVGGGPIYSVYGCTENSYGEACFQKYGDGIYLVKNTSGAVYARWSNWLWNGSAWQQYRNGECWLSNLTNTWSHCNKDFYEDSTSPNAYGSQGSGIRLSLCSSGGTCSTETWTRNDS